MKKSLMLLLLLSLFVGVSFAQDNENEKKESKQAPSKEMQTAQVAVDLAKYGYENKSSISLIQAAYILIDMPLGKLQSEKSEEDNENENDRNKENKLVSDLAPSKLLEDAKTYANNDENLLALIQEAEEDYNEKNVRTKGRVYGPAESYRRVSAYSRKIDYIYFEGREWGEVAVLGDGDNDLDLYIYDSDGHLVAKDDDYTDKCYVSFYVRYTETYKIVVRNRGDVYSDYLLMTN